jgi:hypothetical protein
VEAAEDEHFPAHGHLKWAVDTTTYLREAGALLDQAGWVVQEDGTVKMCMRPWKELTGDQQVSQTLAEVEVLLFYGVLSDAVDGSLLFTAAMGFIVEVLVGVEAAGEDSGQTS